LEEVLMGFCGEQRKANRFCLRIRDAEYLIEILREFFRNGENGYRRIPNNMARYSAINIEALLKYGSLEFRAMEGNLDAERITNWCKGLKAIRDFACKYESPAAIYNLYIQKEAQDFYEEVMGPLAPVFMSPNLVKEIQQGFSLSIDLPFEYVAKKEEMVGYERPLEAKKKRAVPVMPRFVIDEAARVGLEEMIMAVRNAVPVVPAHAARAVALEQRIRGADLVPPIRMDIVAHDDLDEFGNNIIGAA
jgi:hypothetical protein